MKTRIGLLLSLLLLAVASWAVPVQVREEPLTLPYFVKVRVLSSAGVPVPRRRVNKREDDRTYQSVVMENEYVKLQFIPELGGVLYRAIDKASGDDYFYYEGLGKNWYTFWESGIKASFPKAEHSMTNWGQPASYRIIKNDDGSATLGMWMEFSRNTFDNPQRRGLFTRLLLSQNITLRPGEGFFGITYRAQNPSPFKQGVRLWSDAFFPRNQTTEGAVQGFSPPPAHTDSELIYPTKYLSFHGGKDFRVWDEKEAKLGDITQKYNSYFAWDIPYGFVGMWYPAVKVNRLRLWDQQVAPGAKVYFEGEGTYNKAMSVKNNWQNGDASVIDSNFDFVEIWGGTENMFENVENWIGPGGSYEFTHNFTYVRGIDKVDYSDLGLAVHVGFTDVKPQLQVVTLRPTTISAMLDGQRLGTAQPCAPDKPAFFALPAGATKGQVKIVAATEAVLLDKAFPLVIPDDKSKHDKIRASLKLKTPENSEMFCDMPENDEVITYRNAINGYPDGTTARGRVLYRDGQLDRAVLCLRKAVSKNPDDGEAWGLLGCALLERSPQKFAIFAHINAENAGKLATQRTYLKELTATGAQDLLDAPLAFKAAVAAKTPYAPAHYFLALQALKVGDNATAVAELEATLAAAPKNWEAKLLRAMLKHDRSLVALLEAEDPADPRVLTVKIHTAQTLGDTDMATTAQQQLAGMLKQEPGTARRVQEFEAATKGEYLPPARMGEIKPVRPPWMY